MLRYLSDLITTCSIQRMNFPTDEDVLLPNDLPPDSSYWHKFKELVIEQIFLLCLVIILAMGFFVLAMFIIALLNQPELLFWLVVSVVISITIILVFLCILGHTKQPADE